MHPDTPRWKEALEGMLPPHRVRQGESLAPLTTFRIGGPADLLVRVRTPEELVQVVRHTREAGIPSFLLGLGANVLVGDAGFRGVVVRCEVQGVERLPHDRVRAAAGVRVYPDLIQATVQAGLGGLHHFAGIPSTVGGAVWQNLHFLSPAPGRERTIFLEEFVESAVVFTEDGRLETVDAAYFEFGYDYSILHDREDVVLSVTFRLAPTGKEEMGKVMEENLRWRGQRHPDLQTLPSAGSIFKKVEGVGAGRLIDECGLKGRRHGNAQIYENHANIIVNRGGATASDVLALIHLARDTVLRDTGHRLEPEITFVGEFQGPLPPTSGPWVPSGEGL